MLFILTGNGKGKTTCAFGMGLRAAGAGRKVLMIQFLKAGISSEAKVIQKIQNFGMKSFGSRGLLRKNSRPFPKKDFQLAEKGLSFAKEALESSKSDFLILDEINVALHFGLVSKKEVLNFLEEHKARTDIVLTGRYCPEAIIKVADLVTEFQEKKHYYKKGKRARKGIEY